MQACVEEWHTGTFEPLDLSSRKQEPIFDAHLFGLLEYESVASICLARFQKEWYRLAVYVY